MVAVTLTGSLEYSNVGESYGVGIGGGRIALIRGGDIRNTLVLIGIMRITDNVLETSI